jgi:hypothetical protein
MINLVYIYKMELDEISFLFGLMFIPFTFIFAPKLFYNKKYTIPLLVFVLTLSIFGLTKIDMTNNSKPNFYLFLFCPIYSLTLLRILLHYFRLRLHRNPKYPPRNFFTEDDALGWDRLFYFTFTILSLCLPIGILAYFYK